MAWVDKFATYVGNKFIEALSVFYMGITELTQKMQKDIWYEYVVLSICFPLLR